MTPHPQAEILRAIADGEYLKHFAEKSGSASRR